MAKYGYDKKALKDLSVKPFLNEVKVREAEIEKAGTDIPKSVYAVNKLASKLHPSFILGKITKVLDVGLGIQYTIEPFKEAGFTELPYFRAGQYIPFAFEFDGKYACRPYALSCSPKRALGSENNSYQVTVLRRGPGHFSDEYIHKNWHEGTVVSFSSPKGQFYHDGIRDSKNVIALAGGLTAYVSMAEAIADGIDDYNLTIICNTMSFDATLYADRFLDAEKRSGGKVKFVPVLLKDEQAAFGPGSITADLIRKYMDGDTTFLIAGPGFFAGAMMPILGELHVPKRRIRIEPSGALLSPAMDPAFPKEVMGKVFKLKVWVRGELKELDCPAEKTILSVIEDAGIRAASDCRSGECGWCHSRLISGEYFMPKSKDGRRAADMKFGWIHPCCTYALSDMEIEVFPTH